MGHSLANIYIHLIFSTKDRRPWLDDTFRPNLHAYMASVLNLKDCHLILINSIEDHVHILFRLSRTTSLADAVEDVKKSSSQWIKRQSPEHSKFAWQPGYGAFSVSESNMLAVKAYIQNQREHHRTKSFEEEFCAFLKKNHIDYDPKYLWS
ncbi:IS200/IS605 family transposase [Sulfuriroseicoccus oceanibius]|uniref:IS200/IS605 family transposase n=1 Tax=Sulfuriroseicoccus oceanibius TaxID=2707525 RepID=A0A6B3LEP6_9BACT|nr:IS200/IS605 family transposase [Sulfuriroseicoccus oceanibius]QQL45007.1 IS200/IS605 family transposase [Sulfuriroseicoccus oceanibius]